MKLCAFGDEASKMIDGQIVAMKRNGIDLLEIRMVDDVNIRDISLEKAREVRKKLDDAGISVWSVGSPIGKILITDDLDAHLEQYKHVMEIADILGTRRIRMFSFLNFKVDPVGWDVFEEKAMPMMDRLCNATPDEFILCHENEKRIFGQTAEGCLKLHAAFPRLRAVFDPANFVQCGVDPLYAWEMLKDYVDYLHVKDADAQGRVVPVGYGVGQVAEIVRRFVAKGGEVMSVEPHLNAFIGPDVVPSEELPFAYKDADECFDAAVAALRAIL